ncbi:MAG: hypothetical protein U0350_14555 [Caldilineaceae bacterium]
MTLPTNSTKRADPPHSAIATRKAITSLWSWLGAALLYLSLNVLARILWGRSAFLPPLDGFLNAFTTPNAAAVFGILVGAPLLLATLFLNVRYLSLTKGNASCAKLPVAFNFDVKLDTVEGKAYRLLMAMVFVVLPLIVQLICLRVFLQGIPTIKNTGVKVSLWAFELNPFLRMWYTDSGYRLYDTEFYLLIEPMLFLLLEVACCLFFVYIVWQLLRRKAT